MNIEIANRLVQLRKQNNLSQEQLAEKIGVSRQAVSKWERSEASPDTDNLILLARLYNVSLDELLKTEDDIPDYNDSVEKTTSTAEMPENDYTAADNDSYTEEASYNNGGYDFGDEDKVHIGCDGINVNEKHGDKVHVGWDGIHVEEKDGNRVHIDWSGIHVEEHKGDSVHIDKNGVFVNGEKKDCHHMFCDCDDSKPRINHSFMAMLLLPFTLIVAAVYIFTGIQYNCWDINWTVFFAIPVFELIVSAIKFHKISKMTYPIVCLSCFIIAGVSTGLWLPYWVMLLTIPIYDGLMSAINHRSLKKFPYFIFALTIFLAGGSVFGLWHPLWVVLLTIPIYYEMLHLAKKVKKQNNNSDTDKVYSDAVTDVQSSCDNCNGENCDSCKISE